MSNGNDDDDDEAMMIITSYSSMAQAQLQLPRCFCSIQQVATADKINNNRDE
jgi:hypothetical protein